MIAPARTPPHLITLAYMAAVSVLSFNMVAPSLASIAAEFETTYAVASLSISVFLAVNAVLLLILGPLSDRYGRRPVMLWSAGIFAFASIGAALASDITTFLACRILQSTIAGGTVISGAVVRDTVGPKEAASRLGYLSMIMAIAPMVGPMIGGLLDAALGWRAIFWAYALLGGGLFWLTWADAGETHFERQATLMKQVRILPELLSQAAFWAYALVMTCGIGAFYIFIAGVPYVGETAFGLSPAQVGIGLGSITAGFFCGSFVSGRLAVRMGVVRMILLGRLVPVIGLSCAFAAMAAGVFDARIFFAAAITVGIGNGLTTPSARAGAMSVRPDLAGSASGLGAALTVGAGAILTQVTAVAMTLNGSAATLLGLMLCLCAAGLALAFWIRRLHATRPVGFGT